MNNLILASSSPRRVQLLSDMGYCFKTCSPNIDETRREHEEAAQYCERMASEKALVVAKQNPQAVVIGADTIVVFGGQDRKSVV